MDPNKNKSILENTLMTIVQINTNFRKPEEVLANSFRFTSYSLLLNSLRISGAYFPDFQQRKKNSYIFNIICFLILIGSTLRYSLLLVKNLSYGQSWPIFKELLFCINALLSTSMLVSKQKLLHRCLHQSVVPSNFDENQKHLDQLSKKLCLISFGYIVFQISIDWINISSIQSFNAYIQTNYSIKERTQFPPILLVLVAVDIALKRIIILCPIQLIMSLFIVLAKAMEIKFRLFNEFFKITLKRGHQLTAQTLRNYRINRCDLHDMLLELDKLFSPFTMIWFNFFVGCVATETLQLFTGNDHKSIFGDYNQWAIHLLFLGLWFAATTSSSISLANRANRSLNIYQKALVIQNADDCQFFFQAEALLKNLIRPELWMTGWRYFNVDKSAVLSTVSAIFTSLVLILEFNPKARRLGSQTNLNDTKLAFNDSAIISSN